MNDSKSILLIGTLTGRMGKGQSVCETFNRLLTQRGWAVHIASAQVARIARLADMLRTAWINRNQYRVALIDVFSGNAFIWAEVVGFLLRLLNKPYILALYGGALPEFARKSPRRVKYLLNSAAAIVSPTRYIQEPLSAYRSDIRLLSYGIDTEQLPFRLRQVAAPKLITMRALHATYNLPMAVQVLALLASDFPEAELIITGGDKGDGTLEKIRSESIRNGMARRVQMPGFIPYDELFSWIDRSDILLNTTNIDNTPVSVLEAMSCGLCIVSTNVGGMPYLLDHEQDALLVPPNNPEAMAFAVRRILTEPGLAEKLSRNARRKAEQYSWERVLPLWESLFAQIADSKAQVPAVPADAVQ